MKILCEILSLIKTANIYINTDDEENIEDVDIEENVLTLKKSDGSSCSKIHLCKGILFEPKSLSLLKQDDNWLYFRVCLGTKTSIVDSVLGQLARDIPYVNLGLQTESELIDRSVQLRCKCNQPLTSFRTFKKLCPLPSVDWDGASENWFCHLETEHKDSLKSHNLIPKDNECFYNELFICINPNIFRIQPITDGTLKCDGCWQAIGLKKGNNFKLWKNDIEWITNEELIFSMTTSDILLSLFYNLERDSLGGNCRLVLELSGCIKDFLYIMTMDSHLNLLVTDNSPLNHQESTSECDKTPPKKQRLEEPENCFLRKLKSVKLLYKCKTGEDDESGLWVDDLNVNIMPCGPSFFKSTLEMLENSNKCLPQSLATVQDMKVGYIVTKK